jgi:acyl-[acyl-carrier-protein]-phospholipid O-acyltransferase/long-chain-fatty-acid--[acyl-carrier-protein] ligase
MTTSNTSDKNWRRSFWSLILVQFQGAFSDNALKNLVIFLILGLGLPAEKRDSLVPLVGALFATPFILFSMFGGWLADRFSKRAITRSVKIFELGIMLFAAAGLGLKNLPMELGAIFLMGVHSAIFGPSKYGLLPELLPLEKLSWGNGVLELGTFLAIITGTMAGAFFSAHFAGAQSWSGLLLAGLAVGGWAVSAGIAKVPAAAAGKPFRANFAGELWSQLSLMRCDKALWWANWGNAWFFFLAALLQMNLFVHAKDILRLNDTQNGCLQAALAIGIGLGSLVAGLVSRGRIETRLIPLGAAGLAGTAAALAWPSLNALTFGVGLAVLGFFGGFFIVPVSALLQHRPSRENKGGVLAAANLLSFVGIFLASGVYYLLVHWFGLHSAAIFLVSAAFTGLTALGILLQRSNRANHILTPAASLGYGSGD